MVSRSGYDERTLAKSREPFKIHFFINSFYVFHLFSRAVQVFAPKISSFYVDKVKGGRILQRSSIERKFDRLC